MPSETGEAPDCEHHVDGTLSPVDGYILWECTQCGARIDRRDEEVVRDVE